MLSYTLSNAQWVYDVKESKVKKKEKNKKKRKRKNKRNRIIKEMRIKVVASPATKHGRKRKTKQRLHIRECIVYITKLKPSAKMRYMALKILP